MPPYDRHESPSLVGGWFHYKQPSYPIERQQVADGCIQVRELIKLPKVHDATTEEDGRGSSSGSILVQLDARVHWIGEKVRRVATREGGGR